MQGGRSLRVLRVIVARGVNLHDRKHLGPLTTHRRLAGVGSQGGSSSRNDAGGWASTFSKRDELLQGNVRAKW